MTKRIALYLIMALTACIASAQNVAEKYINSVIDKMQDTSGITAWFNIGSNSDNGIRMEGNLKMEGKKFCLETDNLITWYNGKTMWSYAESIGEVNITQPSAQELAEINPYLLLDNYVKSYNVHEEKSKKRGERTFCLTSTKRDIYYNKIILTINTDNMAPVLFELIDRNNNTTFISIYHFDKDVTHPSSTFTFDKNKYPNAAIIDLR